MAQGGKRLDSSGGNLQAWKEGAGKEPGEGDGEGTRCERDLVGERHGRGRGAGTKPPRTTTDSSGGNGEQLRWALFCEGRLLFLIFIIAAIFKGVVSVWAEREPKSHDRSSVGEVCGQHAILAANISENNRKGPHGAASDVQGPFQCDRQQ